MSNSQRLIPFAFGGVIVLLAANLLAGTRSTAEAQTTAGPVPPKVLNSVAYPEATGGARHYVWRFWDDGTVDFTKVSTFPNDCPPAIECGPVVVFSGTSPADITGPVAGVPDGCVDAFDLGAVLGSWCSEAGGNPCGTCGI